MSELTKALQKKFDGKETSSASDTRRTSQPGFLMAVSLKQKNL